jgi:hypothetical protein
MELISQAEYARRRGVSEAAVSKAIKRCRIPLIEGKLDPLVADTLWKARTDPHQQRRAMQQGIHVPSGATNALPAGSDEDDAVQTSSGGRIDWRERRDRAEAMLAELDLQQQIGSLVKAADVERKGRQLAAAIVQQLESIPDRIAAELGIDAAHRTNLRLRLREELDRVRAEIARAGLTAEQ